MRHGLIFLVLCSVLLAIPAGMAQEKKDEKQLGDPKAEKPKKPTPPKPEDALRRAMLRVKKVDDQKFMQMTVLTSEDEDVSYVTIVEFGTGDMAIFAGGSDPANDQWIMLTKQNMTALRDIAERQRSR